MGARRPALLPLLPLLAGALRLESAAVAHASHASHASRASHASHVAAVLAWQGHVAGAPCDPAFEVCVTKFADELPLPPVAKMTRVVDPETGAPVDELELVMAPCEAALHSELPPTRLFCYGGSFPGPTIEATTGVEVRARFVNQLPAKHLLPVDESVCGGVPPGGRAAVHLHGGHQAWESDGDAYAWWTAAGEAGPDAPADPGAYRWANTRAAAPLFYHDHAACVTRLNVWAGLSGVYNLRDAGGAPAAGCGGVSEFPLVLRDVALAADASLAYPPELVPEMFGNLSLVNGALWPRHTVPGGPVAYRLLNAANARFYSLQLFLVDPATGEADLSQPGPAWVVTGADGGVLPSGPATVKGRLVVAPAERFDVTVDFAGWEGARLILHNDAATPYAGPGGDPAAGVPLPSVMAFDVNPARAVPRAGAEAPCPPAAAPPPRAVVRAPPVALERRIEMSESTDDAGRLLLLLEGRRCDDPITATPTLGSEELWEFINTTPDYHPMHMHLVAFTIEGFTPFDVAQYLATGDLVYTGDTVPPEAHEAGPRDVVKVPEGMTARVRMTFDREGLYMFHCASCALRRRGARAGRAGAGWGRTCHDYCR